MNIDLHAHVKLSKKSAFTLEHFSTAIREAAESGLDAIAMTEHFNTVRFHDIYEELDRAYAYKEDYYDVDGFRVFPGMEVDVRDGGHILVLGTRENVLELRSRLEPHVQPDRFVAFEQLLDWCDELHMPRFGAHPYRESNPLTHHDARLLRRLHGFDLNAKDLHTYGMEMKNHVCAWAEELGIPVVAGSDTHHFLQFGSVVNALDAECGRIEELAAAIAEGRYRIEVSPALHAKVKGATLVKKLLKQQLAAGANHE